MRLIAFVPGRPKPQPRVTQNVKFLFGHTVEHWQQVDQSNAEKTAKGDINRKGNPYKPSRYAYRLQRLQAINEYRDRVRLAVGEATAGNVPHQDLFFFYLFKMPKTWSKKKRRAHEWTRHIMRPDYTNLLKGIEDSLYKDDGPCNAVAHYKLYVPDGYQEGFMILKDEEIHQYVIDTAIDIFTKSSFCLIAHNEDKT